MRWLLLVALLGGCAPAPKMDWKALVEHLEKSDGTDTVDSVKDCVGRDNDGSCPGAPAVPRRN